VFELRKEKDNSWIWSLGIVWLVSLIPILVCGLIGYESHPEAICVALPAWTGFILSIISLGWRYLVYTDKFYKKSGWTWSNLPYIFWGLKETFKMLYVVTAILLFPIFNSLEVLVRLVATFLVVIVIPDGKAETRIKKIWGTGIVERT